MGYDEKLRENPPPVPVKVENPDGQPTPPQSPRSGVIMIRRGYRLAGQQGLWAPATKEGMSLPGRTYFKNPDNSKWYVKLTPEEERQLPLFNKPIPVEGGPIDLNIGGQNIPGDPVTKPFVFKMGYKVPKVIDVMNR